MDTFIELNKKELDELELLAKTDCAATLRLAKYYSERALTQKQAQDRELDYQNAALLFERAWLEGDLTEAAYELGWHCYYGVGIDEDRERGKALFEAAYARGHARAGYMLGNYHRYRHDDLELAARYYFEAAERGEMDAIRTLTWAYKFGSMRNLGKNLILAEEWARKGAESGDKDGQQLLGDLLYDLKRYEEAIEWFNKSIKSGNDYAKYKLGLCYEHGYGVARDIYRAIELYEQCPEDSSQPKVKLCYIYLERYNTERLKHWLNLLYQEEKGAEDYFFVNEIVKIIETTIKKDPKILDSEQVFEILEWAVTLSSAPAECLLGDIYSQGVYGHIDNGQAVEFYCAALKPYPYQFGDEDYDTETHERRQLSAEDLKRVKKIVRAQAKVDQLRQLLAALKEDGDEEQAPSAKERIKEISKKLSHPQQTFKDYQKRADKGDISATYTLADFYFTGTGTPKDYTKAAELLLELDKKNTRDLLDDLGLNRAVNLYKRLYKMHKKGMGVKKDSYKAKEFKDRITALKKF